ncbi:MAG: anti-sigma factor, partial [Polaromonas sp.]|nr:anti-sigma factor [Polaromonas sp.]
DVPHRHAPAANDGNFRWKLVAGIASLAAVSAIAWNATGLLAPATAPQLAQAPVSQQVVVASPQGPVVRDARLEELLAAHKQLGGTSALQEPSGFLRNATFETPRNAGR